jgi:hypothetical protein
MGLIGVNYVKSQPAQMDKCIIGEATNCGYIGMKAVALVYRNRLESGMQLGCVALNRPDINQFVKREGLHQLQIAKKINREVFVKNCEDFTNGATHFENIKDFGVPYWAKDMVITLELGRHTFYKEK